MPAPKGHKKWGGKKKGAKNKKTIEAETALVLYKQEMLKELIPLIRSQQQLAKGLVVVLRRNLVKKGNRWVREGELTQVRDADEIERLLNSNGQGENWHIITIKDPNVKAIQDILDRIFGKAKETIDVNVSAKARKLKSIQDRLTQASKKNE